MTDHFSDIYTHIPALTKYPRAPLFNTPTSLETSTQLGNHIGINLDIKRDDNLALAMGGNKIRQLEYYLGDALEQGADTILITGAVQSNFVRLCAASCRKLGLHPVVQLENRVPNKSAYYNNSGNVLLLNLLEADINYFDEGENEAAADENLEHMAEQYRLKGHKPYVIHLGISFPPIGGLGYVAAAVELWQQYQNINSMPQHVIIPSGSALTHAGFLAGARAIGWDISIHGICVRRNKDAQKERVLKRAREINDMLDNPSLITEHDVQVDDHCLAPGYGQMNDAVDAAIKLAATKDALLVDPVYSGRALAGLIHHVKTGTIKKDDHVTFIHTGGTPILFGYQDELFKNE